MAIIVFLYSDTLHKCEIAEGQELTVGSGSKDSIFIESLGAAQVKLSLKNGLLFPKSKKIADFQKSPLPADYRVTKLSDSLRIYVCWGNTSGPSEKFFRLPYRGIIRLGRSDSNDIILKDPIISGRHLALRCEDGAAYIEDGDKGRASTNGTYLNGKRIARAALRSGDVIDLMHIRIIFKNSALYFDNVGDRLFFRESGSPQSAAAQKSQITFRRSPRTRESLPQNEIILARPPQKASQFEKRRGMFTSLLGSGAMIGASIAMGAASPALLAARAASLVSPVANMAMGHDSNKKGKKKYEEYVRARQEKYGAYMESQKALILQVADKQREIITRENPAPAECVQVVGELRRTLWERSPQDPDFLDVRVGMGYESICVPVKTPMDVTGFRMEEDDAEELLKEIVQETRIVDRVPARVRLGKYSTVGVIGQRTKVVSLIKNMLLALCTAHFYEDVRIVGIFDEEERELWEAIRWLPHIWDEDRQSRFLAFDAAGCAKLSDMFHDILRGRLDAPGAKPHYIFLLGSYKFTENCLMMQELLTNAPALNATAIFLYNLPSVSPADQIRYLPHQCQFIVDTDERYGCCAYDKRETNMKFMFELDRAPDGEQFDRFCRTLSAIRMEGGAGKMQLPGGITFLQGMGVSDVEALDAWERWRKDRRPGNLSTPLAVTADGKPFSLDIGNENEPPVVLVAGMAGSGKSEFLAAWLLSLSLNYHPYEVSFVVIDFKGGALANSLQALPHMVGKITDLKNDVQRTITSLMFEIKRREMIFEREHMQKLSEYTKGYRAGRYEEPLPYLLIVCDEFAELKQQQPEIAKGLDSVARLGRSVGVRLICAMQNPMGVVNDELRANSCCQVCLKVQNIAASKDMILRPDAAMLTQNGRAYVRVGADVVFEQVQSYWSGAPYFGEDQAASAGNQVRVVSLSGERIKTVYEEKTRFRSDITELEAVSDYLTRVAREHNLKKMPCPWLDELPEKLLLEDIFPKDRELPWLRVPIGLFDLPEAQKQGIQFLDLEAQGHTGIYGTSGTGKTTLLKTILLGLGTWYSPKDVNIYILDLGSWGLKFFEEMPHVGGVALGNEEEKFDRLAAILKRLFEDRKRSFSQYGVHSLKAYRETVAADMPAVVLAIDNLTPIYDAYPAYESLLQQISAEGASYGIYVIFTANSQTGIKYKFLQNIRGGIAFEMNEKSDYTATVGRVENPQAVNGIKGRAFFKSSSPIVFQTALCCGGKSEREQIENLKAALQEMRGRWGDDAPSDQLRSMPENVGLEDILPHYIEQNRVPVGLLSPDAEPACLDFENGCCAVISGGMGGGKSSLLSKIAQVIRRGQWVQELYIIDSSRKSLASLSPLADGYAPDSDEEALHAMLTGIVETVAARENRKGQEDFTQICVLVDDIQDFVDRAGEESHKFLRILCKNGHGLGFICIAAGRVADLAKLSTLEALTITMLSSGEALVVSGSASANVFLKNNLSPEEKSRELTRPYGLIYHGGKCKKVKFVQ